jgi:biopolymer transport protein TolQ
MGSSQPSDMTHVLYDTFPTPMLANALTFAFEKATVEGKLTIGALVLVSMLSWTVIITKSRQIYKALTTAKKFFAAYRSTRDPLDLFRKQQEFDGAPAYEVYYSGCEELEYHLKNNPITVKEQTRISSASFESIKAAMERAVSTQGMSLEKGMIILSTAVAGGPFIGLLGTVWGVMETFSGVAKAQAASLAAMAPGVAGALIATVVGLFVAIPAMFAYNYMVTTIRAITQELDNFATEFVTAVEHTYVDNRAMADEIADALRSLDTERSGSQRVNEVAIAK